MRVANAVYDYLSFRLCPIDLTGRRPSAAYPVENQVHLQLGRGAGNNFADVRGLDRIAVHGAETGQIDVLPASWNGRRHQPSPRGR